ncbi:MAG: 50S ribosomal protein L6 [Chloroflexota bacterium]
MSRIGKLPITIPAGVKVEVKGSEVSVEGAKGKLTRRFHPNMTITLKEGKLTVSRPDDGRENRALHGLTRNLLANMVTGVSAGFEKSLEIVGVGYRAEKSGAKLVLRVGFSHSVEVVPPAGVSLDIEGANRVKVKGADKEAVGQVAANLRAIRPPDAYKGKGIRYAGEVVKIKPGKTAKAVGSKQ